MCAWAQIEKPSLNFAEIVSEEISKNLQAKKEKSVLEVAKDGWIWIESDECDQDIIYTELKANKASELPLSDENYDDSKSDPEEEETKYISDGEDGDGFDYLENEPTSTYDHKLQNSDEVLIKYDIVVNKKKKETKSPSRGDGIMLDFKSSKHFSNGLKIYLRKEEVNYKLWNKTDNVFIMDPHSHVLLHNMIISKFLKSVDCVINTSTEGVILHGTLNPFYQFATENWPKTCAIKVFGKTAFKSRRDVTYLYKEGLLNETKSIQWWTKMEMNNLVCARKAGVACPQVIKLKNHILVMSFIGTDKKPAKKLKYAGLSYSDFVRAYQQVKNTIRVLYEKVNLIHGDMSEFNILWHENQCYFVDFSHSLNPSQDNGYYFLHCDCVNMTNYFGKRIPDIESADELFTSITGFHYGDKFVLKKMQKLYKSYPNTLHQPSVIDSTFEKVNPDEVLLEKNIEKAV